MLVLRNISALGLRTDSPHASSRLFGRTLQSASPRPSARGFFSTCAAATAAGPTSHHGPPFRILFCGTDNFARTVLKSLIDRRGALWEELQLLVPADAGNDWNSRKRIKTPPTKELAQQHGLVVHTLPPTGLDSFELPEALNHPSSLLLTASFGHLLPPSFLSLFPPHRALNLHPSLLPQLRGAAPLQWALASRLKRTGVSVQEIGAKFDTGDLLAQEEVEIGEGEAYDALEQRLAGLGANLLCHTLEKFEERLAASWPQSQAPAQLRLGPLKKAPKLKRSDSEVAWHRMNARDVEARHRAFSYLYPLTTTLVSSSSRSTSSSSALTSSSRGDSKSSTPRPTRVILSSLNLITDPELLNGSTDAIDARSDLYSLEISPGACRFVHSLDGLLVKCAPDLESGLRSGREDEDEKAWLLIRSLKSEGKKQRTAKEWIVGYRDRADDKGRMYFD